MTDFQRATTIDAKRQAQRLHSGSLLPLTKVPTLVFQNAREVDRHVALVVESLIRENNSAGLPTVLGLPTGSTPIGVYRELIRLHEEEDLDFSRVVTFNIDEYWPIQPDALQSYNRWMRETFFEHVNIPEENIHIPDGTVPHDDVDAYCEEYERAIRQAGGIDLMLLGIGRTGHIGFNEPGSPRNSVTRLVTLDPVTRQDAASDFFSEENVPLQAISMGVGTILSTGKIILIALGEHKAPIIRRAVEEEVTPEVTASFLQQHPNALFAVDRAAANDLTAVKTPWLAGRVAWSPELEKRAVIWLSLEIDKPLPKLETADFIEHGLYGLIRERGPIDAIRQRVFHQMLETICTHPGEPNNLTSAPDTPVVRGSPDPAHDVDRRSPEPAALGDLRSSGWHGRETVPQHGRETVPQHARPTQSRTIIVFSPHPDDDVISMGGTLITLAEQAHDVHVAYMTSGNIAVFDHDALRHIDYVSRFQEMFLLCSEASRGLDHRLRSDISSKQPGAADSDELLAVKALIRQTEAQAAAQTAGIPAEKLHFLNLPFYRTGRVTKRDMGEEDIVIVVDLLRSGKPDQIYVAGDLSDPHGTHRVCAQAIMLALERVREEGIAPEVWLYRGAWQEYEPHEIERAVPLSPEVALRKKMAIFKHESQKDRALFPGHDQREFWVRAEARTKNTARAYNALGLPEYFALEGFVRYAGQL